MSKQISKFPDEANVTQQGSIGSFRQGLVSNKDAVKSGETDLAQRLINFDITQNGSLVTRAGLTEVINLKDYFEFDRLITYKSYLTDYYRVPSDDKSEKPLLVGDLETESVLLDDVSKFDYVLYTFYSVGNAKTIIYPGVHGTYTYSASETQHVVWSVDGGKIKILENTGVRIVGVDAVNYNLIDNPTKRDNSAKGILEVAVVSDVSDDGKSDIAIQCWGRYSKIDIYTSNIIEEGEWQYCGDLAVIEASDEFVQEERSFYTNKRIYSEYSKDMVYFSTPRGYYMINYVIRSDETVGLELVDMMSDDCPYRYKPTSAEVTVNGYNLLAPEPEFETQDQRGVVNSISGIVVQGVDIDNKTQPFKVQRPLIMEAFVTYLTQDNYEDMRYKWSYDYIGSSYTDNLSFNKRKGENEIQSEYGDNKVTNFTPNTAGMYRLYCQMEIPNSDGEYEETNNVLRYVFVDIQVETDVKARDDVDYLFLHNGIKQSKVIRRFKNYFVVGGASQTSSYSSKLFFSAPNDLSYFPQNYVITMPTGIYVSDFCEYNNKLIIFTNQGVYMLDGDVPYSVAQLATDKSLKSFEYIKLHHNVSLFNNDNLAVTPNGVVTCAGSIYKMFDTSTEMNVVKDIGGYISDMIPQSGFSYIQQVGSTTYMVNEDEILIYETLPYDIYGIGNRFNFYHMHGLIIRDIFEDLNETFFVLETGQICLLDKKNRGRDLTHPFPSEFKTVPDYCGNEYMPKKFKNLFYKILPIVNTVDSELAQEESYCPVCDGDEVCTCEPFNLSYSTDVWVDDEQVINSMYVEAIEQFGGGWKFHRVRHKNTLVRGSAHMISEPKLSLKYGKHALKDIYGKDILDQEVFNTFAYIGALKLLSTGSGSNISVMMRFHEPVLVESVGYDFKTRGTKGHYSANNHRYYKRVRR